MQKQARVQKIVIVGGGTAGWITAAGIASIIPADEIAVELVESEAIGIIGVGEATLPHLRGFNRRIGDLFVDCTGFGGLLIEETLQTRLGSGHVYSSQFLDDDAATQVLLDKLEGAPLTEARTLRFTTGKRKKTWNRNCIAIGLSGGFLEPLESTSIYLIQVAARHLVDLLEAGRTGPADRDEYNRRLDTEFLRVRDFLILHYHATDRTDSEFWNYTRNMEIPDSLAEKIELFKSRGQVPTYQDGLFQLHSWLAVYLGQHLLPESWDERVDQFDADALRHHLGEIRRVITEAATAMGDHAEFIQRYCNAGE